MCMHFRQFERIFRIFVRTLGAYGAISQMSALTFSDEPSLGCVDGKQSGSSRLRDDAVSA